jgi:E3 ubiquitin-protein ligase UHRF1
VGPRIQDADRPDEAFRTERAVRKGLANAASGRLMVSVPLDHFGPIPPEAAVDGDAECEWFPRVGAGWNDRLHCRQWGAHFPHVAGIAGQSGVGAQSVVLSGGYEDDRDEGEWFLYTGSGGRDLSGNKRVSAVQSFDQAFDKMNEALRVSCERGLPVRVVRSAKEKRSAYAPAEDGAAGPPLRYDGIYMVTRAYRKPGTQGKLVCRYLFVRCDNEPAPWSSEEVGDRPDARPWEGEVPAPAAAEIAAAVGPVHAGPAVTDSWWGWDGSAWGWTRPPPDSRKLGGEGTGGGSPKRLRRAAGEAERALREFKCRLCARTLTDPLSTPCGHNFCKPCLTARFAGIADTTAARAPGDGVSGRSMRVRAIPKPCPACKADCAEFMKTAQVNVAMAETIAKLAAVAEKARADAAALEQGKAAGGGGMEAVKEEEEGGGGGEGEAGPLSASPPAKAEAAAAPSPAPAAAAAPSPPPAAPSPAAPSAADALAAEFPAIDRGTIEALLADQDGDARDVRVMLGRMAKAMDAEARKAKAAAAAVGGGVAAAAAEGGAAEEPVPAKKRPGSGGRPRSGSAGAAAKRPRSGSK